MTGMLRNTKMRCVWFLWITGIVTVSGNEHGTQRNGCLNHSNWLSSYINGSFVLMSSIKEIQSYC